MTAKDFERLGVVFVRAGVRMTARVPRGVPGLSAKLLAEVEARVPRATTLPPGGSYGTCALCADAIPHYAAGLCDLCALARRKALRLSAPTLTDHAAH